MKAEQRVPGERNQKWQEPSQGKACHRWRLASRGQQALRLGSVATVKQVRKSESPYETVTLNYPFSCEDLGNSLGTEIQWQGLYKNQV